MPVDRRQMLRLGRSWGQYWVLLSVASAFSRPLSAAIARASRDRAALLVPLTGPSATLGLSMQRAASLVQPADPKTPPLTVIDTGGTPAGAAAAARVAIKGGARLILGPLFAAEARPILAEVAGRVPVVTFSNDAGLYDSGAFVLGITAAQMTGAVLRYARQRGVRRVAVLTAGDGWAAQVAAAAQRIQGEIGIEIVPVPRPTGDPSRLPALLAGAGGSPDAVLLPDGGAAFVGAARALRGSGVQVLGTMAALDYAPGALQASEGAWIAAPSPTGFASFAERYEARHGGAPGAIAALAYDGAAVVERLRAAGRVDRAGLLAIERYDGATGALRFRSDGSCARDLAILVAGLDGYAVAVESVPA